MVDGMTDDYPKQIKSLRAKLGLTQVALAERLGVSFPTVNRWENGKSRPSQLSWQAILDLSNLFLHPLDRRQSVLAEPHDYDPAYHITSSVQICHTPADLGGELDLLYIGHTNGCSGFGCSEDDRFNV